MIPWSDTKRIKELFILLLVGFPICTLIMTKALKFWWSKYPHLEQTDILNNKLLEITAYQSTAMIKLDDGRQLSLLGSTNYDLEPDNLNQFLQVGDILIKPANSDTIKIIRSGTLYIFVHEQFIHFAKRKY